MKTSLNMSKIKISQIKALLYEYFLYGLKNGKVDNKPLKISFLLLLNDFLDGKIDVYALDGFAGDILYFIKDPHSLNKDDPDFASALDTASDLTFFFKRKNDEKVNKRYQMSIKTLKDYLKSNTE